MRTLVNVVLRFILLATCCGITLLLTVRDSPQDRVAIYALVVAAFGITAIEMWRRYGTTTLHKVRA